MLQYLQALDLFANITYRSS